MQFVQVGDLKIAYEKIGEGPLLILLHGWANTWEAWLPIIPILADHFTLIIPDVPGFGNSEGPTDGWSTHQYALWLSSFLRTIQSLHPNRHLFLAGHSFGGKIGSYYVSQDFSPHIDKLVLLDASGIPGRLTRKQRVLKLMALATPPFLKKTVTQALRTKIYRSFDADSDYLHANESQRRTLKKILPENMKSDLLQIEIPTLIIWGKHDPATPLSAGEIFHRQIHTSTLHTYDAGHFPHHEHSEAIAKDIIHFLSQKYEVNTKPSPQPEVYRPKSPSQSLATQLAILQQSEYEWPRFQDWLAHQKNTETVEPKKWTEKLKLLATLTRLSTPIIGQPLSLWLWNGTLKVPQFIYFSLVIMIATWKLRLLESHGLIVICIAGSYAKTSTKYALHHVLKTSFPTLMTPENINTPFGIASVILSDVKPTHRVFIAELGEYYPGDIASLTRFLHPQYKILTPIGFAHLERFQTVERLEKGLAELIATPPTVPAYVHEKNERIIKMLAPSQTVQYYGDTHIGHVSVTRAGTEFDVHLQAATLHTFIPLLGQHQAENALPAILLAHALGVDDKTILGRLQTLPQVPHRLEPTLLTHNILLLDNGYNSNPAAARESLATLEALDGSQRIVITPGFVEMGSDQEIENEKFGQELARVCDYVGIVTGSNETALLAGLTKEKFPSTHIVTGSSEIEVMNTLTPHIKPNAIVLFENSIPDVYKRTIA